MISILKPHEPYEASPVGDWVEENIDIILDVATVLGVWCVSSTILIVGAQVAAWMS